MPIDTAIFSRHLDLEPFKGKRRGKTFCIFHGPERTPSLSVDLDAGVFHCFACGAQGGVKAFAVKVGEVAIAPGMDTRPGPEETPWLVAMRLARRQAWNRAGVTDLYTISDWIRRTRQDVARIRALPDVDWELLARAADLERVAAWAEQELDAIYAEGPIS